MFDRLIKLLEDDIDGVDTSDPLETASAVAALYFHMIAADGVMTTDEITRFRSMLQQQFDLNDEQLNEVVTRGAQEERASPGLFPFTSIVNSKMDGPAKAQVMRRLNELAGSDGEVHQTERDMLAHVERLLRLD